MTNEKQERRINLDKLLRIQDKITDTEVLGSAIHFEEHGNRLFRDIKREYSPKGLLDMYIGNVKGMMASWMAYGANRDFLIITDDLTRIAILMYTHPEATHQDLEKLLFQQRIAREFVSDVVYVERVRIQLSYFEKKEETDKEQEK